MRYKAIIKRVISPSLYTRLTGIDLSHIDQSKIKCLEIEEQFILAPNRKEAFSAVVKQLKSSKESLSLTVKLA